MHTVDPLTLNLSSTALKFMSKWSLSNTHIFSIRHIPPWLLFSNKIQHCGIRLRGYLDSKVTKKMNIFYFLSQKRLWKEQEWRRWTPGPQIWVIGFLSWGLAAVGPWHPKMLDVNFSREMLCSFHWSLILSGYYALLPKSRCSKIVKISIFQERDDGRL